MKTAEIVDTNVILRFLVGDNAAQHTQAEEWFKAAEKGKKKLVIKSIVVAEASFVLESYYKQKREDIAEAFIIFLSQKWLVVEEREVLLFLWDWYKDGLHFVDSYLLASATMSTKKVLSFDKELLKKLN